MKNPTIKEMCETIAKADFLRKKDGTKPTAREIFNYSPSGELFMIWDWYYQALQILRMRRLSKAVRRLGK